MNKRSKSESVMEGRSQSLTKLVCRLGGSVSLALLLSACSSGDQYADINIFMEGVKAQPVGSIAPLPEFDSYQAFSYSTANRRSPFEPPIIVAPKSEEQKRNVGIKPPQDHVKQYLEKYNLAALSMVGTLEQDGTIWARVGGRLKASMTLGWILPRLSVMALVAGCAGPGRLSCKALVIKYYFRGDLWQSQE